MAATLEILKSEKAGTYAGGGSKYTHALVRNSAGRVIAEINKDWDTYNLYLMPDFQIPTGGGNCIVTTLERGFKTIELAFEGGKKENLFQ